MKLLIFLRSVVVQLIQEPLLLLSVEHNANQIDEILPLAPVIIRDTFTIVGKLPNHVEPGFILMLSCFYNQVYLSLHFGRKSTGITTTRRFKLVPNNWHSGLGFLTNITFRTETLSGKILGIKESRITGTVTFFRVQPQVNVEPC